MQNLEFEGSLMRPETLSAIMPFRTAFHVAPAGLVDGAVIQPGSWGRLINRFSPASRPPSHEDWQVTAWEIALEASRLAGWPSACSRLACVFATENLVAAQLFRQKYRPQSGIYRVEPTEGWDGIFRGDYSLITSGVILGAYATSYPEIARQYWAGPPGGEIEMLIPRPVEVLESIT